MKEVLSKKELKMTILSAVDLICDAVSSTLGPSGNNVIINADGFSPYITNDGVSIALSIESSDKKVNTIVELIKEASIKTNELVGDGTTTTLVLLKSIIVNGLKTIEKGKNSILLKKELDESLKNIIKELENKKRIPTKKDYEYITTISSNDEEIGKILSEVYFKIKNKNSIIIEESNNESTYYEIKKGYSIEIDKVSDLYFQNQEQIILNDVFILLLNGYLSDLNEIAEEINEALINNKNLIIFADEYEDTIINDIVLYHFKEHKNIFLFKYPDYGSRKLIIKEDIISLSKSNNNLTFDKYYGYLKKVIISKDEIILFSDNNLKEKVKILNEQLKKTRDDYEKDFIKKRISKLNNGIATIYVGAQTKTERREKLMRFEDALCALNISDEGVVSGEGLPFYEIGSKMIIKNEGDKILKEALLTPINKIFENSGINKEEILEKIKKLNYELIYNFNSNRLEKVKNSNIIDPVKVLTTSLKNAVSISSMILTTNYLVINEENDKKLNINNM